jgi:hypothetical protein
MVEKLKKIEIEWIDSKRGDSGWEYRDGLSSLLPAKCKTIGFLLEDTPAYKTVAPTISETQILGRISIPCCCILKVKKLD